jgi:ribonuclease P protein component
VPKRQVGAIERNRVKRIIRAALQGVERRHPLRRGFLIVLAARPGIEGVKSPSVESELRYIFKKLEMFEPQPQAEEAKAPSAPHKEEAP